MARKQRNRINPRPVGARLRNVRVHFRLTQEQMAEHLQICRTAYRNNELGNSNLDLTSVVHLRNKLGLSMEWLLFNNGPMLIPKATGADPGQVPVTDPDTGGMVKLMNRIPFVRHAVMGFFRKFQFENGEVIRKFLETESGGNTLKKKIE